MQQQCATLLGQAAAAVQPCGAQLSLLPRLRLTQPLRSQALNGRRHMLPFNPSYSSSSTVGRALHSGTSSSSRQLLQPGGRQAAWRGWVQQQLGGSTTSSTSSSSRVFLRLRSGFSSAAAAAPGSSKAAAAAALPSWGATPGGVASWFNNMPAAAAWWDSWMLWVGSQSSFVMATLLNSLNTVGNKLPVALGLLLVDWVHHSPLLHGSRADALHPPALADKVPAGGFYATTKAAGAGGSSSSSGVWRSTVAAWGELLAGLSAGARLLWLGCIWLPALLSAPLMLGCCGPTGRSWWLGLITLSLEASGPAFIKWGQVGFLGGDGGD